MRAIPSDWFKATPSVYWIDLAASAGVGWIAFVAAVRSPLWERVVLMVVATAALYRSVLFIHEITHRAGRDVPGFRFVWNAVVGVPFLLPSFLYEGVHNDHHRQHSYGTRADPEYIPYAHRRRLFIAGSVLVAATAPVVGFLRFAVAAPLGWLLPSVRRVVRGRLSALVINPEYVRHDPLPPGANLQEAAACAFCWTAAGLWFAGVLPAAAVACWACGTAAASLVNGIRTIAAHRYENEAEQLTMVEQLLDSCTIVARTTPMRVAVEFGHAMVAPVGLRYHSLHHWIPALPYHRLGAAHRRLTAALCPDAPYRSTVFPGFAPVIRTLFDRAGSRR